MERSQSAEPSPGTSTSPVLVKLPRSSITLTLMTLPTHQSTVRVTLQEKNNRDVVKSAIRIECKPDCVAGSIASVLDIFKETIDREAASKRSALLDHLKTERLPPSHQCHESSPEASAEPPAEFWELIASPTRSRIHTLMRNLSGASETDLKSATESWIPESTQKQLAAHAYFTQESSTLIEEHKHKNRIYSYRMHAL